MPDQGAGPFTATEVRCRHCQDRVLTVLADRGKARTAMVMHLIQQHGHSSPLVVEGKDFLCGPAPLRCDLCMAIAEPPFWTYTTGEQLPVEDPKWLVCDPCHEIITSSISPLPMLVQRSFSTQTSALILDGVPEESIRGALVTTIGGFLDHLAGEPVRS